MWRVFGEVALHEELFASRECLGLSLVICKMGVSGLFQS